LFPIENVSAADYTSIIGSDDLYNAPIFSLGETYATTYTGKSLYYKFVTGSIDDTYTFYMKNIDCHGRHMYIDIIDETGDIRAELYNGFYYTNNEESTEVSLPANSEFYVKIYIYSTTDYETTYNVKFRVSPSEKVSKFTLSQSANFSLNENAAIAGELELKDDINVSSDIFLSEVSAIKWTSSDQSIVPDSEISCLSVNSSDNRSAELIISFTPYREGKVTITGTVSNGLAASCEVTVMGLQPTENPDIEPTLQPTQPPEIMPTIQPTQSPEIVPTLRPTAAPATNKPNFTISIINLGNLWGWDNEITGDQVSLAVSDYGTYTLSADVPEDCEDINSLGNALWIDTTLTELPTGYTIVPKIIKVNDTEYDWSKTAAYVDADTVRLGVVNGWIPIDDKNYVITNPLNGQSVAVNKGDKLTFTFEVKEGAAVPTDTPITPPADGKLDFNATIRCYGNFYGWESDTPTDATATVHVSDFDEYNVSFVVPDDYNDLNKMSGAIVVQTDLTGKPNTHPFTLVAKTVKIGNTSYDWSKAEAYLDGDNIRMSVRNEWFSEERANPLAGQVIPINEGDVISFTFEVKEGTPSTDTPTKAPTETPAESYNAYLGFQTDVWDYRDSYEKDFNSKDYDFASQAMIGGEPTDVNKVKIKNAAITGNGTYSVSMTGADLSGGTEFKMLYISTGIPAARKNIKFSNIKVIIDGTVVTTLKDGVVQKEVQSGKRKYYMIMAVNAYGTRGVDLPDSFAYTMPEKSLELQFTVSGLDIGQDYSTETYGAKKGTTFAYGNLKYRVTVASTITAGKLIKGKARVVGLSAAGRKKAGVSVPASVSYTSNGQKAAYTVNTVAEGAFKKAAKLKTVTLSKNIRSIKKDTFQNCVKLTTLKLNAKLISVAKDSFKGCKKTITVKGTSKTVNIKLLKKKNVSVKFK